MHWTYLKCLLFILSVNFTVNAQDYSLQVFSIEGEPLSDVYILGNNSNYGNITDEDGQLLIKNIIDDTLYISHVGYKSQIFLINKSLKKGKIILEPEVILLSDIEIRPIKGIDIIKEVKERMLFNYDSKLINYTLSIQNIDIRGQKIWRKYSAEIIGVFNIFSKKYKQSYYLNNLYQLTLNDVNNVSINYYNEMQPEVLINRTFLYSLPFFSNINGFVYEIGEQNSAITTIIFKPKIINTKFNLEGEIKVENKTKAVLAIDFKIAKPSLVSSESITIGKKNNYDGVATLKQSYNHIEFRQNGKYYVLKSCKNESSYGFKFNNSGQEINLIGLTDIVVLSINQSNLNLNKNINLYDLKEWKSKSSYNNSDMVVNFYSKRLQKKLNDLKSKYPDLDISELEEEQ